MNINRTRINILTILAILALSLSISTTNAQCTPDPACSDDICPDSATGLASAVVGVMYSEVITVVIPTDTLVDIGPPFGVINANVDSVTLSGLTGLPPGLTYTCAPPSCTWPGGTSGCILISGTPTDTGTFDLMLYFDYYLFIPALGPFTANDSIGYYSIVVNATGCSITSSFTQSATTVCEGDSISFTNTGDAPGSCGMNCPTFSWDYGDGNTSTGTDAGAANPSHTYTTTGTYTVVQIIDDGSCSDSTQISITVNISPSPTISVVGPTFFCQGDTVTLTSSSAMSYLWSNSATSQSINVTTSGSYDVTVTDANGCSGASTLTSVTVGTPPTINLVTAIDASGCGASDGKIAIAASGGSPPLLYSADSASSFVVTDTIYNLAAGSYIVALTDSAGCIVIGSSVSISAPGSPTTSAGADADLCEGSSQTMSGTMGGTASSITWTTSGTGIFDSQSLLAASYTPSVADITAGTVTLTITTNDPDGVGPCLPASDEMILTIDVAPTTDAGADATVCAGLPYTLNGATVTGASALVWTTSGTGSFIDDSTLVAVYNPSTGDEMMGAVTLTLTTNDPAGPCTAVSDAMVLIINEAAEIFAGNNAAICDGDSYTLSGYVGGGANSATWATLGSGTFDDNTLVNATYTPSAADISSGSVLLTITSNNPPGTCLPVIDNMTLTINPNPAKPTINQSGNNLACSVTGASYQWYLNSNILPGETGQVYTMTQAGFYSVTVIDNNGCSSTSDLADLTLGIGDDYPDYSISVFPNPSSGEFVIEVNLVNNLKRPILRILNEVGQVIYEEKLGVNTGTIQKSIDLTGHAAGLYNLQLRSDGQILLTRKIILEK